MCPPPDPASLTCFEPSKTTFCHTLWQFEKKRILIITIPFSSINLSSPFFATIFLTSVFLPRLSLRKLKLGVLRMVTVLEVMVFDPNLRLPFKMWMKFETVGNENSLLQGFSLTKMLNLIFTISWVWNQTFLSRYRHRRGRDQRNHLQKNKIAELCSNTRMNWGGWLLETLQVFVLPFLQPFLEAPFDI